MTNISPGIVDACLKGFVITDDDDVLLAACDCGIEQISSQHELVRFGNRDDYGGILRSLGFMNGNCIGRFQCQCIVGGISEFFAAEFDNDMVIPSQYSSDVSVHYADIIII